MFLFCSQKVKRIFCAECAGRPPQAMMSGVIWSSMKAIRSRNCSLRFFSRCSRNKSGAGDWCSASIAASRSRCSWCNLASSDWSSRSSSSVMVYLIENADEICEKFKPNHEYPPRQAAHDSLQMPVKYEDGVLQTHRQIQAVV